MHSRAEAGPPPPQKKIITIKKKPEGRQSGREGGSWRENERERVFRLKTPGEQKAGSKDFASALVGNVQEGKTTCVSLAAGLDYDMLPTSSIQMWPAASTALPRQSCRTHTRAFFRRWHASMGQMLAYKSMRRSRRSSRKRRRSMERRGVLLRSRNVTRLLTARSQEPGSLQKRFRLKLSSR